MTTAFTPDPATARTVPFRWGDAISCTRCWILNTAATGHPRVLAQLQYVTSGSATMVIDASGFDWFAPNAIFREIDEMR